VASLPMNKYQYKDELNVPLKASIRFSAMTHSVTRRPEDFGLRRNLASFKSFGSASPKEAMMIN